MADQAFTQATGSSTQGVEGAARTARSAADEARSTARDLKDKAADLASSSTEAIKDKASEFVDAAKDLGSQAADRVKETVEDQKSAGAQYVGGIAEAMRRAAREFDHDLPIAGTYMRMAASQVDTFSDSLRNGDINDLVRNAQDFARRQPTAFLGIAVLAGFGVVRFLKSSAEHSARSSVHMSEHGDWRRGTGQQSDTNWRRRSSQQTDTREYVDELTR